MASKLLGTLTSDINLFNPIPVLLVFHALAKFMPLDAWQPIWRSPNVM
ncbi:MAG: hypothetical protein AAFR31_07955 [Cyanobacteria bacterium J06627_8]